MFPLSQYHRLDVEFFEMASHWCQVSGKGTIPYETEPWMRIEYYSGPQSSKYAFSMSKFLDLRTETSFKSIASVQRYDTYCLKRSISI